MDDSEYYTMMRQQNLHRIKLEVSKKKSDYKKWVVEQGREDAEMLEEKKTESKDE